MSTADVTTYYLEMLTHHQRNIPTPSEQVTVTTIETPTVRYYRFLYDAVGREYNWILRNKLNDTALATVLEDPHNDLLVLSVNGSPAGFADLIQHEKNEIELLYFGLMPEFIGRGLGTWFLQQTVDKTWIRHPQRLWLHTCTLDHPAALKTYLNAGFRKYKEETKRGTRNELPT
ncbi:MAG: GNAT family N-acetyltransferase [Fuerstiella sp.]|nr:GNAT family N-acetyltransferase [Fuerstiella sp.]